MKLEVKHITHRAYSVKVADTSCAGDISYKFYPVGDTVALVVYRCDEEADVLIDDARDFGAALDLVVRRHLNHEYGGPDFAY